MSREGKIEDDLFRWGSSYFEIGKYTKRELWEEGYLNNFVVGLAFSPTQPTRIANICILTGIIPKNKKRYSKNLGLG